MAVIGTLVAKLNMDSRGFSRGSQQAQGSLAKMKRSMKLIAPAATAAGIAVAGIVTAKTISMLKEATRTFIEFTDSVSKVRAITGASITGMKSLEERARSLGASTVFTASQVAEAMTFLGMAGMNTNEILDSISGVLDVASAGGVDLAMAADIVTDVGTAMGLTAKEMKRVGDVLAKVSASANTNIEMMGETMKFVAPIAFATGQSLEEVAAAAGILGNAGIKASIAGTDLKNILSVLAKDTKVLGVSTRTADGKMRPLIETLGAINKKTAGMTKADRAAAFIATFGERSAKSALNLASMAGEAESLKIVLEKSEGTAKEMAKIMQDNLGGALKSATSAFEGLQISIVDIMESPMIEFLNALAEKLRSVTFATDTLGIALKAVFPDGLFKPAIVGATTFYDKITLVNGAMKDLLSFNPTGAFRKFSQAMRADTSLNQIDFKRPVAPTPAEEFAGMTNKAAEAKRNEFISKAKRDFDKASANVMHIANLIKQPFTERMAAEKKLKDVIEGAGVFKEFLIGTFENTKKFVEGKMAETATKKEVTDNQVSDTSAKRKGTSEAISAILRNRQTDEKKIVNNTKATVDNLLVLIDHLAKLVDITDGQETVIVADIGGT